MALLVLVGVLVLVVGGCVCVAWASRGGPRWVRGVAAVTLALGRFVAWAGRGSGRGSRSGSDSGSDD